jgi:hypothetical protein
LSASNQSSSEKPLYLVFLWTDLKADGLDLYEYVCRDHCEAVALAISEHKSAGRPLSMNTRFLVEGPCPDRGCDCGGKLRAKMGFVCPETTDRGWTN